MGSRKFFEAKATGVLPTDYMENHKLLVYKTMRLATRVLYV